MSLQRGIYYVWANATKQECTSFNHHAISYHSRHKKKERKSDNKALHGRERTQILKFGLRIVGEKEKNARNPVFQNAEGVCNLPGDVWRSPWNRVEYTAMQGLGR